MLHSHFTVLANVSASHYCSMLRICVTCAHYRSAESSICGTKSQVRAAILFDPHHGSTVQANVTGLFSGFTLIPAMSPHYGSMLLIHTRAKGTC